jgi:hypothetical protein
MNTTAKVLTIDNQKDTITFTTSTTGWGTATAWQVYGFQCKELRRTPEYPTRFKTYQGGGIDVRENGTTTIIHLTQGSTIQVKRAPHRSEDGLLRTIAVFRPQDVVRVEIPEVTGLGYTYRPAQIVKRVYTHALADAEELA